MTFSCCLPLQASCAESSYTLKSKYFDTCSTWLTINANGCLCLHLSALVEPRKAPFVLVLAGGTRDLVISSVLPADADVYTCVATNDVGSVEEDIEVVVHCE